MSGKMAVVQKDICIINIETKQPVCFKKGELVLVTGDHGLVFCLRGLEMGLVVQKNNGQISPLPESFLEAVPEPVVSVNPN